MRWSYDAKSTRISCQQNGPLFVIASMSFNSTTTSMITGERNTNGSIQFNLKKRGDKCNMGVGHWGYAIPHFCKKLPYFHKSAKTNWQFPLSTRTKSREAAKKFMFDGGQTEHYFENFSIHIKTLQKILHYTTRNYYTTLQGR